MNSIIIPNNIKTIRQYAFYNAGLSDISILSNQLKELVSISFRDNNLTSLEIPEEVERIGHSSFSDNRLRIIAVTIILYLNRSECI